MRVSRYALVALATGLLLVTAFSLTGCGSGSSTTTATTEDSADFVDSPEDPCAEDTSGDCEWTEEDPDPDPTDGNVSREEYGKAWPLTVDGGTVACEGADGTGEVWFTSDDGDTYAVNGLAQGAAKADGGNLIDEVWKDDKYGGKIDISPLIEEGLALCE